MMLTDLDLVLRRAGLDVREVGGWRQRGHGPMKNVLGVTCHHTASGRALGVELGLGTVVNGRPGLKGPLAHLYLNREGTFIVVAAGLCYHAGVSRKDAYTNPHRIGIEALAAGDGWSKDWPAVQLDAYALGCKALADHYGFKVAEVLGHKETCSPVGRKIDPTIPGGMAAFRKRVAAARKPTPPAPPTKENAVAKLDKDDYDAIADRVWQKPQALTGQTPGGALHEVDVRTTGGDLPSILAGIKSLTAKVEKLIEQHGTPEPPTTPGA